MAASQLSNYEIKKTSHQFELENFKAGQLPGHLAETLISDYESTLPENLRSKKPVTAPVLIAPLTFLPLHSSGSALKGKKGPFSPLIVPAVISKDGKLSVNLKSLPWFSRSAMEPSAADDPIMGTLDDFDKFRSTSLEPEGGWKPVTEYVENMCKAVTGCTLLDVTADGYDRGLCLIQAGDPPISPLRSLMTLTDSLISDENYASGSMSALDSGKAPKQLLDSEALYAMSRKHVGQMGGSYPLADLQRESVLHMIACQDGDVLAVNGPPGTGKTTLLQSVVATLYVQAALDGEQPPVIFAASTNNQAVTNIIDSFGDIAIPRHKENDPATKRWIPDVTSFGVYLPSAAAGKRPNSGKYQIATLPKYGKPLAGFPADLLATEKLEKASSTFLTYAGKYFGEDNAGDVETVLEQLSEKLNWHEDALDKAITALEKYEETRVQFAPESLYELQASVDRERRILKPRIEELEKELAKIKAASANADKELSAFEETCHGALKIFEPTGLFDILMSFIPNVRAGRWDECRHLMISIDFREGPFSSLTVPKRNDIRLFLSEIISEKHQLCIDLRYQVQEFESQRIAELQEEMKNLEASERTIMKWKAAEISWLETVDFFLDPMLSSLITSDLRREDFVEAPNLIERVLDVTYRYEMFMLATHYWEARWLISSKKLEEGAEASVKKLSRQKREDVEFRFQHMAQLTPCFISTLFMLPGHLTYWNPDGKKNDKNPPLKDFVDLLIVDEAGQVPAEIGAPALALSKQSLIVGDIYQIEPVWNIGPEIDHGNLKTYGLSDKDTELDLFGALAKNGSLMKLARGLTSYKKKDEDGMFLAEHRRCQKAIINVCNDLVYKGALKPRTPLLKNPILPALGWGNIRSASGQKGTSKFNDGEAKAIAEWLSNQRPDIEHRYNKQLEEVVAVVTPFGAQKAVLREAMRRYKIDDSMTVGTVHALQGAEREIVLFSPTHTMEDGSNPFFDRGSNMINVAVSRAKDSFITFGDMRIFNPENATAPSSVLAKNMFKFGENEIRDIICRPELEEEDQGVNTYRIDTLKGHQEVLRQAFLDASGKLLITTPYLTEAAIKYDKVPDLVKTASGRGVKVMVAYDPQLNQDLTGLRSSTKTGIKLLTEAGATVQTLTRAHNKTLAVDDKWIVEGSFNWLSAVRDGTSSYNRVERSFKYHGPSAAQYCDEAWEQVAKG